MPCSDPLLQSQPDITAPNARAQSRELGLEISAAKSNSTDSPAS